MADLNLLILGSVRLEANDGVCVGRLGVKAKALLAYLATQPDGRADRDVLANLLWDACPQAEARHSLRQALLTLRTQLGDYADALLKADRESLQLCLEAVNVDLLQFDRGVRSADDKALVRACDLWRGSFCDGLDVAVEPFEEWLLRERARLDELAAAGFKRVTQIQVTAGRFEAAICAAQQCVALNPFDDSVHADLIDLYGQRGWVGSARKAYRRCADLFQRELGEAPNEGVQAAIARALERRDCDANPRPSLQAPAAQIQIAALPVAPPRRLVVSLRTDAMALSVVAVVGAVMIAGTFLNNEVRGPIARTSDQTPAAIAWVGTAEAYPRPRTAVLASHSAEISRIGDAQQITTREAISRALQMDPDYAYLYPAGC